MSWTWQYEKADGSIAGARGLPKESFGSQGDAETWLGEHWRSLLDDGRCEYGPMSLHPAQD